MISHRLKKEKFVVFQNPREREDETKNERESEISRLKSTGQSRVVPSAEGRRWRKASTTKTKKKKKWKI